MNVALLTMALALYPAQNTVVQAVFAPDLAPDRMAGTEYWKAATSNALEGCQGKDAQSASVRALWNDAWFFFEFSCSDSAVCSPGERDGLDHYLLGDTVEVFLAPSRSGDYAEVHATPAGRKTFYFFRDYRQPAPLPPSASEARVVSSVSSRGWRAVVAVPRALFPENGRGGDCFVFFARYDYAATGAAPVLSSFPAQREAPPDFHRRADYAVLRLEP